MELDRLAREDASSDYGSHYGQKDWVMIGEMQPQHYENGADRFEIGMIDNMTVDSMVRNAALDMEFSNGGLFHHAYCILASIITNSSLSVCLSIVASANK